MEWSLLPQSSPDDMSTISTDDVDQLAASEVRSAVWRELHSLTLDIVASKRKRDEYINFDTAKAVLYLNKVSAPATAFTLLCFVVFRFVC